MKQIEVKNKKNVLVSSFTKFFRVGILSLFVMLAIPSISSGIFGNGDAEAGCNAVSNGVNPEMTDTMATAICGGLISEDSNADGTCKTIVLGGEIICSSTGTYGLNGGTCVADTSTRIRCVYLSDKAQCDSAETTNCIWTVEDVNNNKLVDAVCRVYQIATGTAGKAFAAVGVISVGIGFFTGKVSWGLMISVAAGIAVFFGAPSIIAVISGDQSATALCNEVSS